MKTDLIKIPGVGKNMKEHFIALGYTNVESLVDANPEIMYEEDKKRHDGSLDRCVLYVYRLAVEFAKTRNSELKWWNFTDEKESKF